MILVQVLCKQRHPSRLVPACVDSLLHVVLPSPLIGKLFALGVDRGRERVSASHSHDLDVSPLLLLQLLDPLLYLLHLHSEGFRLGVDLWLEMLLRSRVLHKLVLVAYLDLALHARFPQAHLLVVLPQEIRLVELGIDHVPMD